MDLQVPYKRLCALKMVVNLGSHDGVSQKVADMSEAGSLLCIFIYVGSLGWSHVCLVFVADNTCYGI